ncbi:MAG: hypothetical protein CMF50_05870 [Legionellales bacterium]|nr:hypothetical protein [Legionellales bacterium]|tara:strand:+ start:50774 stop:51880 length:1107 start_codon:yes stop_codon:yes gene_type:complete
MDGEVRRKHYRPLYKHVRIGSHEYAILDKDLAQERAENHLNAALRCLDAPASAEKQLYIDRELAFATDFGCKDAPYLLALRILDCDVETQFLFDEAVVFLKLAAERGNTEAAYCIACSYAGTGKFRDIEDAGSQYFGSLDGKRRARLAEQYFGMAVQANHSQAIEDLIIAYAYGRGFIQKSADKFVRLCEQQICYGNQAVALGYGAWLAGMTVDGNDPLPDAITLRQDPMKALDCLLYSSRGDNISLAQHALQLICCGMQRGVWPESTHGRLRRELKREVKNEHQLLGLYCAWYSIAIDNRPRTPKMMEAYQLTQLAGLFEADDEFAISCLDTAVFGEHDGISNIAKNILAHSYGKHLMDEDDFLLAK